ncbi:hypothetical protein OIV19_03395 [Brucella sp. HL-2]|nr:hypothetical protein [Brucella sp. HL-2]MCV9906660.1 hypothetical protein [Brucella sp. HL-2]
MEQGMYCIQSFGLNPFQNGLLVQTSRGFFEINEANVCRLITALPRQGLVSKDDLYILLKRHIGDDGKEVLAYLGEVLGIVSETKLTPSSLSVITSSNRLAEVARVLNFELSNHPMAPKADVNVLLFEGTPDEDMVRNTMQHQPGVSRLVIGFLARNNFVVSSVWSANSSLPCPMCVIDFALDRVFYDPKDTVMGLSDVYSLARSLGTTEPHIPLADLDIAFVLRYLRQHTDALTGMGFGGFAPFDPLMASIIDFTALNRQSVRVPFSPLCDCIHRYPVNQADGAHHNA